MENKEKKSGLEKMNQKIDRALEARVAELQAGDDETGDGRVDMADMKKQLDRIEAQLELQDKQNRRMLQNQKLRLILTCIMAAVLVAAVVGLWMRIGQMYTTMLETCTQVNELAGTLQESLQAIEPEQLQDMMEDLPEITESLKKIDVDALNDVLQRMPLLMDAITAMQQQLQSISSFIGNFSLGSLLGGA